MRQDNLRGSSAIAVHRSRATAGHIDKAVELGLRMVKTTGTGPTVGATKDRGVTKIVCYAFELI